jgi:hypothetical protein
MIYGVSKRELVNVLCEVEANPVDVEFKWTFNNSAELIRSAPFMDQGSFPYAGAKRKRSKMSYLMAYFSPEFIVLDNV